MLSSAPVLLNWKEHSLNSRILRLVSLAVIAVGLAACTTAAVQPSATKRPPAPPTPSANTTHLAVPAPTGFRAENRVSATGALAGPLPKAVAATGECNGVTAATLTHEGWVASDLQSFGANPAYPKTELTSCLSQFRTVSQASSDMAQLVTDLQSPTAGSQPATITSIPGAVGVETRAGLVRIAFSRGAYVALVAASSQSPEGSADLVNLATDLASAQYATLAKS